MKKNERFIKAVRGGASTDELKGEFPRLCACKRVTKAWPGYEPNWYNPEKLTGDSMLSNGWIKLSVERGMRLAAQQGGVLRVPLPEEVATGPLDVDTIGLVVSVFDHRGASRDLTADYCEKLLA